MRLVISLAEGGMIGVGLALGRLAGAGARAEEMPVKGGCGGGLC